MLTQFRFLLLVLALTFGGSSVVAVSAAWAQVRAGSLEEQLFNSVRNKDMNGVRAALNAGANVFATDMLGNRAADVAVDLSQFDIAHYLLSAMDHRRSAQKQAVQQAPKPVVALAPPVSLPPVSLPPVSLPPVASPPVVATPTLSLPQPTGPNPFAVTTPASTPPSSVVSLSKPHLRMAGAKSSASTSTNSTPVLTLASEPQSTLYIKPGSAPEVAAVALPEPTPVLAPAPAPAPALVPLAAPEPMAVPVSDPTPEQAPTPEQDPTPEQAPTPEQDRGWFSKMTSLFSGDDEPKPAPQPAPEVATIAVPVVAEPTLTPTPMPNPTPNSAPARSSNRTSLQLTAALMLGKAPPPKPELKPASMRAPVDWPCVNKGRWGIVCLELVRWPDDIAAHFNTPNNTLYRGRKVMVGYEDDRADFFYAVFNSSGFKPLVEAFTRRLGAPDMAANRQIKPFQKLLEVNPVRTWFATDPQTGREMILEISMFEDQSSTFPVMDEGAIKLTYTGEESVFRYTSPMELQRFN